MVDARIDALCKLPMSVFFLILEIAFFVKNYFNSDPVSVPSPGTLGWAAEKADKGE